MREKYDDWLRIPHHTFEDIPISKVGIKEFEKAGIGRVVHMSTGI